MSLRTERVAEEVRRELARLLSQEATDPRLRLVTLTRVDVAPDLSHALVFWSTMGLEQEGGDRVEEAAEGLEHATSFLRRRLAAALPIRRTPELRFRHDPSLELGGRTLSLLSSLRDEEDDGEQGAH